MLSPQLEVITKSPVPRFLIDIIYYNDDWIVDLISFFFKDSSYKLWLPFDYGTYTYLQQLYT